MKKIWFFVMCICFSASSTWAQASGNGYFAPQLRGKFVYTKNGVLTYDPQGGQIILNFIMGSNTGFNNLAHYPQSKIREDLLRRFSLRFGKTMTSSDVAAIWPELKAKYVTRSYWNNADAQGYKKASAYITKQGEMGFQFPTRETFILYHPIYGDILDLYCGNPVVETSDHTLIADADEQVSGTTTVYVYNTIPQPAPAPKQENDLVVLLLKEMREDRAMLLKLFDQRSAPAPVSNNNDDLMKLVVMLGMLQGNGQQQLVRYAQAPQETVVVPRQNRFWDAFEGITGVAAQYGIFNLLFRGNGFGGVQQVGFPSFPNYGGQQIIGSPWGTNINTFAPQPAYWIDQPINPGYGGIVRPPYNTTPIGGSRPIHGGGGGYNMTLIGGSTPNYGGGSYNPNLIGVGGVTRIWNTSNIGG